MEDVSRDWKSTFDSIEDMITLYDKDYRLIRCNKALLNRLKARPEEIIGKKCYEVFHNMNKFLDKCPLREVVEAMKPVTKEIEEPCLGGIFSISSFPRFDDSDEFVGTILVMRDITELRMAEDSERRGIFIANFLRVCHDFVEVKPVLTLITSALAEHLNVPRVSVWFFDNFGDLVCQKLYEHRNGAYSEGMVFSGKDCPNYMNAIMSNKYINAYDARTDPRTKEFLNDYLIPSNIFSMLCIPIKIKGKVSGVFCLEQVEHPRYWHKDEINFANTVTFQVSLAIERISEHEIAEKEIKASEVRLRNIIANNADGIIVIDRKKVICFANLAAESLFGLKAEELIGKSFDFPVVKEGTTEIHIIRKGGVRAIAEMRAAGIEWEKKDAFLVSLRDVTVQKKKDEKLIQSYKLASLGQLAAGIFHEVLNPLNIISSHVQLLLMETEKGSNAEKDLMSIQEEIDRIVKITDGLLRFSRKGELATAEVEINSLLGRIISIVGPDMRLRNIELIYKFRGKLPKVLANEDELRQVFLNLTNNARDAMPDGGTLTINTQIIKELKNSFVRIKFMDTGCGIPAKNMKKIFDPFFTTKKEGKGTGLGLSTSYSIIENHGGTINVQSEEGKGTTFMVDLPVKD